MARIINYGNNENNNETAYCIESSGRRGLYFISLRKVIESSSSISGTSVTEWSGPKKKPSGFDEEAPVVSEEKKREIMEREKVSKYFDLQRKFVKCHHHATSHRITGQRKCPF